MLSLLFKKAVFKTCTDLLEARRRALENTMAVLKADLQNEAKSTAGDKHETGRAMLQLEMEKLGQQLLNTQKQVEILKRIPYQKTQNTVASGSLLEMQQGVYFISLGLGAIQVNGTEVVCLAPGAPLGQELLGKPAGASVMFRNQLFTIKAIL